MQRVHVTQSSDRDSPEKHRRQPFAISLPTTPFSIAAFAEAWEYDDDEDMFGVEDDELGLPGTGSGPSSSRTKDKDARPKVKNVGVLERKANTTLVGGEIVIGKEARGNIKVCPLCYAT